VDPTKFVDIAGIFATFGNDPPDCHPDFPCRGHNHKGRQLGAAGTAILCARSGRVSAGGPSREGLRLLAVEIHEPVIEAAIARGLLKPEDCAQSSSVMRSAFAAQLSDTALNWLTSNAAITRERRAYAVAILQRISEWLEGAVITREQRFRCRCGRIPLRESTLRGQAGWRGRQPYS